MIWGKNSTIWGRKKTIFSQIGKVFFLNLDFSANLECFRLIVIFFSQMLKNLAPKTRPGQNHAFQFHSFNLEE